MDLEEQKRRIAALATIEQGGGDISHLNMESPEVTRMSLMPRTVAVPGVAQDSTVPDSGVAGVRDEEMEAAKNLDNKSQSDRLFEAATRQLIAGLTRTPVAQTLTQPTQNTAELIAKRRMARADALKELELGTTIRGQTLSAERNAALDKRHEMERAQDLEERKLDNQRASEGNKAHLDLARAGFALSAAGLGLRKDEAAVKEKERADKAAANTIPVFGGNLQLTEGLGDAERSKARDTAGLWNAADQSVANFQKNLEEFAKSPSVESRGKVIAALRTASSAFNTAIGGGAMSQDEAKAMSQAMGADVLAPEGISAFAQSFLGDDTKAAQTISTRVRAAREANRSAALGRLGVYGKFSGGDSAGGKVTVSNGKETLIIDASDLKDAEADGYRRVK